MTDPGPIGLIGAGGHAKVVADLLEQAGAGPVFGFYDDNAGALPDTVFGLPVRGTRDALVDDLARGDVHSIIVAIGSNTVRARIAAWAAARGYTFATAVHPSARLSRGASVGAGSVVMAGAVINADARVGDHVIVNTCASVDHDCEIADGVHLAPGSTLCGRVVVGLRSFVAAGATVIPNRTIGADVIVGAGATVIADIADGLVVGGTPARPLHGDRP